MTRLFADPIPARLVWDEGELTLLQVAGRRFTVVEVMRRWRVEASGGKVDPRATTSRCVPPTGWSATYTPTADQDRAGSSALWTRRLFHSHTDAQFVLVSC